MFRYLEITSTLIAQQAILLEKLPGWSKLQIDDNLNTLKEKEIIKIRSNIPTERIISLDDNIERDLNNDESQLRSLLCGYITHL
jgi:hypothetical protein